MSEPTKTYEQECREACEWCAKSTHFSDGRCSSCAGFSFVHHHATGEFNAPRCTAPTHKAYEQSLRERLDELDRTLSAYVADNGQLTKRLGDLQSELRAATDALQCEIKQRDEMVALLVSSSGEPKNGGNALQYAEHAVRVFRAANERAEKAEGELINWHNLAEARHRCMQCGGPETTDKDCICGGTGRRSAQVKGLEACIQYWRKLHSDLSKERDTLRQRVKRLEDSIYDAQKRINSCFGGMGTTSAIWSNNPYDKGHTAGIRTALTAFLDATREALAQSAPIPSPTQPAEPCKRCGGAGGEVVDDGMSNLAYEPCPDCTTKLVRPNILALPVDEGVTVDPDDVREPGETKEDWAGYVGAGSDCREQSPTPDDRYTLAKGLGENEIASQRAAKGQS